MIAAYQQLGAAIGFSAGGDADAPPDEEGVPLDPQAAVRAERLASAGESFGLGSSLRNGVLAGLRQASFWLMKRRARTVGEQGMHQFISQLQAKSNARVHLMGHSFGCVVVSSILGGPGGKRKAPAADRLGGTGAGRVVALVVRQTRSRAPIGRATSAVC